MAERSDRKLAVILHADIVGSTTLVHSNATLAHDRIQDVFTRLSNTISTYAGTAHELRGDALLAEFDHASDAVCAALAFQAENARHNDAALDGDIRPEIRIGIFRRTPAGGAIMHMCVRWPGRDVATAANEVTDLRCQIPVSTPAPCTDARCPGTGADCAASVGIDLAATPFLASAPTRRPEPIH